MDTKLLIIALITLLSFISCDKKNSNEVHLKGQFIEMDNNEVSMDYNGASSYLGRSRSFIIKTDEHGFFDTTFVLN